MMMAKARSGPPGGGSKLLSYIIIILLAALIGYYLILPAFTPKSSPASTTTTNTSGAIISLTPSTDIAGTMVTITGAMFPANQNVSVMFGSTTFTQKELNGTCFTSPVGQLAGCNFWVPKSAPNGPHTVTVTAGSPAVTAEATFSIPQYSPPVSTVVVTLTSLALGFVTQVVTRKVVDLNKERRMRAEVNAFNKEKREATLAKDKVKREKLKKRELAVRQEQAKVSTARLKVTGITFVPLLVVYYLMASFLGGYGVIVAYTPIPIPVIAAPTPNPSVFEVSLFWWYFLSSFTFSTMLSKLLHTTT